jgi:two-component system chemotaxis response regulator CheY
MPQRNGFDLVPVIRSYEEHKTTPIIFLTSTGTADNISAAVKLGACDYVVKPFQADLLRQKVAANIIRKKQFEI